MAAMSDQPVSRSGSTDESSPAYHSDIHTIPPTPSDEAVQDLFDSHDSLNTKKQYLDKLVRKPPGPRNGKSKSNSKSRSDSASGSSSDRSSQEARSRTASSSTANSGVISTIRSISMNDVDDVNDAGNADDKQLHRRRKQSDSGVVSIDPSWDFAKLAEQYSIVKDQRDQLDKVKDSLELKVEMDGKRLEELEEDLQDSTRIKNTLEPRTRKAEDALTVLKEKHSELILKMVDLEKDNLVLNRAASTAMQKENQVRLLNQSQCNHITDLLEEVEQKGRRLEEVKAELDAKELILGNQSHDIESMTLALSDCKSRLSSMKEYCRALEEENMTWQKEAEAAMSQLEAVLQHQQQLEQSLWKTDYKRGLESDENDFMEGGGPQSMGNQNLEEELSLNGPVLADASTLSTTESETHGLPAISPYRMNSMMSDITRQVVFATNDWATSPSAISINSSVNQGVELSPSTIIRGLGAHNTAQHDILSKLQDASTPPKTLDMNTDTQAQIENHLWVTTMHDSETQTEGTAMDDKGKEAPLSPNAQPSPREVFEMMKPVTLLNYEGPLLPAKTYRECSTQTDRNSPGPSQNPRPVGYVDVGVQKDPEHVEILRHVLSQDFTGDQPYSSRVKNQGLLKMAQSLAPTSANDPDGGQQTMIEVLNAPLEVSKSPQSNQFLKLSNNISSISTRPKSPNLTRSPICAVELPIRMKEGHDRTDHSDEVAAGLKVEVLWPSWWLIAIGMLTLAFLTHSFLAEKRLWSDANDLTHQAVVRMRDEYWGSEWIDRMGYVLELRLGIDHTGFC